MNNNRPVVIINVASTLDGIISLKNQPLNISSEEDWLRVYSLRNSVNAILVGVNTVINDNPSLTVKKITKNKNHLISRVVLDSYCKIDLNSKVILPREGYRTIVFCSSCDKGKEKKLRELNVEINKVPRVDDRFLSLTHVLNKLKNEYLVDKLLVEGGGQIITSFIKQNLFDELYIYYSPIFVGTIGGISIFPIRSVDSLANSVNLKVVEKPKMLGNGFVVHFRKI